MSSIVFKSTLSFCRGSRVPCRGSNLIIEGVYIFAGRLGDSINHLNYHSTHLRTYCRSRFPVLMIVNDLH